MSPVALAGSHSTQRRGAALLVTAGLVLGVLGVVGYFAIVLGGGGWLPSVRNDAIPNWIVIAGGLALSTAGLVRARRRVIPAVLLALNVALAAAFAAMLYVMSAVPPASGPPVGSAAPPFALVDQNGKTVRLEDFRGSPVVLVFYRGHW